MEASDSARSPRLSAYWPSASFFRSPTAPPPRRSAGRWPRLGLTWLDTALRAERIEADIRNTDRVLLPNMVADARVTLASPQSALVIPQSALVETGMGAFVQRVEDGKAHRVPVTKGLRSGKRLEVFGKLQAGDVLVAKATAAMPDGARRQLHLPTGDNYTSPSLRPAGT